MPTTYQCFQFFVLCSILYFITDSQATAVLTPSASVIVVCSGPGQSVAMYTFTCMTDKGGLLLAHRSSQQGISVSYDTASDVNESMSLGTVFDTKLINIEGDSLTATATVNVSALLNINTTVTLVCDDTGDAYNDANTTFVPLNGPPPAPAVNPITVVDEGSINSTLLISWSQSSCAVLYVVTIINPSDNRVYPNISTSNTNTTVTLPTDVEFCVTLVAVDSIGRRGPDTTPVCYQSPILATTTAAAAVILPTSSNSVTHSPGMMEGRVNAAAVAIPVVLVLLLLLGIIVVVGVVYVGFYLYYRNKGLPTNIPLCCSNKVYSKRVQVFSHEVDVNKWGIVCVVLDKHTSLTEIIEQYENSGYSTDGSLISVQVASDKDDVDITIQNVTQGWNVEQQQDYKPIEDITVKDGATFIVVSSRVTTTTFIVSSSETGPPDLILSLIVNSGETVTFKRKASRRCVCQVFCCREGLNHWRTTFAFFPEQFLDRVKQIYKDLEEEPPVYFYIGSGADAIGVNCEGSTWPLDNSEPAYQFQVSRAAVEGSTGEGEPPCIVMTLRAVSDETTPPNLTLPVTLTGVRKQSKELQIQRPAEDPTGFVCQVYYHHNDCLNHWTARLVFCPVSKFKNFYQDEEIGPNIDIRFNFTSAFFGFPIKPHIDGSTVTSGWKVMLDSEHREVNKYDVMKYTGDGVPPFCMITIKPISDETTPPDLKCTVFLAGTDAPNRLQLTRKAANSQLHILPLCMSVKCSITRKVPTTAWKARLVFCPRSEVKNFYQDEETGPNIDIKFSYRSAHLGFSIKPNIDDSTVTSGWKVMLDSKHKEVKKRDVMGYTGDGDPPFCMITIKPISDETTPSDLKCNIFLQGIDAPNSLQLTRKVEHSGGTSEALCDTFPMKSVQYVNLLSTREV